MGKNILAPLGLSAVMSATDAAIQKKMYGSGMATLIISNDDLDYLIKIVTALEKHDIVLKRKRIFKYVIRNIGCIITWKFIHWKGII